MKGARMLMSAVSVTLRLYGVRSTSLQSVSEVASSLRQCEDTSRSRSNSTMLKCWKMATRMSSGKADFWLG